MLKRKKVYIGVTGNMSAGKSVLLDFLEERKITVIKADDVAKKILYTEENKPMLVKLMGEDIFNSSGDYDFIKIQEIVFSHISVKDFIADYLKDKVWPEIEKIAEESGDLFIFVENALLFESRWEENFHFIICLYCTKKVAIERTQKAKPHLTKKAIRRILDSQLSGKEKANLSDIGFDTTRLKKKKGGEKIMSQVCEYIGWEHLPVL